MRNKTFKTLDEQISILEEKGMIIEDYDYTKDILLRENYFFLSGYRHLFMRNYHDNRFIEGTTFEELYSMFLFDRKIRNIFFKNVLVIENNVKSIISYQLSKKYGHKDRDYLNPKNFNQDPLRTRQVKDVLNKMKRQIRVNGRQHTATLHYINNYGYIPLWILVKVLSLGIVSELYSILKVEDQETIASHYNIDAETLGIYLSLLSNYRNVCAHEDILYTHRTQRVIPNTKFHKELNIEMTEGEYNYGKNDLFAAVIVLKTMLSGKEFREFIKEFNYEVEILDGKVNTVELTSMLNKIGFPDNWKDISNID